MSWHTIKIRKADKMFSDYIREKSGWKCEYCGKICRVNGGWVGHLDASHYFSRRHESTRFDPQNVHALCPSCHRRMGGYTRDENGEYDTWMKQKLGDRGYKLLKLRANTYQKKDDKLAELYIQKLMSEIK